MLCTIFYSTHCRRCHNPASVTLGGMHLCWPLLYVRHRRIHQSRRCRSDEWNTVKVFLPIMPDLFLLSLYYLRPLHPAYLISYLSSAALVIPVHIYFVVYIVSPICYISSDSASIAFFQSACDTKSFGNDLLRSLRGTLLINFTVSSNPFVHTTAKKSSGP